MDAIEGIPVKTNDAEFEWVDLSIGESWHGALSKFAEQLPC